ncbi:VOC family protein [Acidovorax sp. LjRoot74]|uniref:VOC family protein n=1 Tax=Acidovorax sp. LjRoot74 TaxID=3342337 RepID=UPI003ECEEAEA
MQFGYTILYVEDVPKTIAFYERAFGLVRRFVHEAGDFGELDTGATALAFSSLRLMAELGKNPQRASADAPSFEIAFTTADVAAAVQRAVGAGARLVQAPAQMPWGQTVAYVADINGALVELCTPMGAPSA